MKLKRILQSLSLAVAGAWLATAIAPATAQQPAAPPPGTAAGKGLPMWVIRDADSTIYITGTVHLLPDGMNWRSEKLDAALQEATELWLELAELGAPEGLEARVLPVLEEMLPSDQPLSSMLTKDEQKLLDEAVRSAKAPPDIVAKIDHMQPWYAAYVIGGGHESIGGYTEENGIDRGLARLALARGAAIKGFETIEFQLSDITDLSPESQLAELRSRLAPITPMKDAQARVADVTFGSWARGETHMIDAMVVMMTLAASGSREGTDSLLKDRNENWAGQIEEILAGSGVAFVAVGALHLAGPDSLQQRLKLRGIETQRY